MLSTYSITLIHLESLAKYILSLSLSLLQYLIPSITLIHLESLANITLIHLESLAKYILSPPFEGQVAAVCFDRHTPNAIVAVS
ncbi:hypothetical protein KIPB_013951, partial [Kipferlia bialata]|eukprot:g13951.t1